MNLAIPDYLDWVLLLPGNHRVVQVVHRSLGESVCRAPGRFIHQLELAPFSLSGSSTYTRAKTRKSPFQISHVPTT